MNRFLFFFLAAAMAASFFSCDDDDDVITPGNGEIQLASFNEIEIAAGGTLTVNISEGSTQAVAVRNTTAPNTVVVADVSGGVLSLALAGGTLTGSIDITIPDLEALEVSGSGDVTVSGFANLDDLDIELVGTATVEVTGSSVTDLNLTNLGTGTINAFGLSATDADCELMGIGSVSITVSNELTGTIAGTGNLNYKGSPTTIDVDVLGTGMVIDAN